MDFAQHTPYILAAYSVSIVALGALIAARLHGLKKARDAQTHADMSDAAET